MNLSKNIKLTFLFVLPVLVMAIFVIPMFHASADGLVPDCGTEPCGFNQLFDSEDGLVKRVIDFILIDIIIPLAMISIAVAGFKMIIQSDKEKAKTEAKEILWAVFIGLFVAFAGWLIIKVILTTLVNTEKFNPPVVYIYEI